MYHRSRFNTQPLYVADPDEPEPISEPGPASPSSGEDTKTEAPSPQKWFHLSLLLFLVFSIYLWDFNLLIFLGV